MFNERFVLVDKKIDVIINETNRFYQKYQQENENVSFTKFLADVAKIKESLNVQPIINDRCLIEDNNFYAPIKTRRLKIMECVDQASNLPIFYLKKNSIIRLLTESYQKGLDSLESCHRNFSDYTKRKQCTEKISLWTFRLYEVCRRLLKEYEIFVNETLKVVGKTFDTCVLKVNDAAIKLYESCVAEKQKNVHDLLPDLIDSLERDSTMQLNEFRRIENRSFFK